MSSPRQGRMSSHWQRLRHDAESHSPSLSPRRLGRHVPSRDGLELVEWVFSYSGSLGEISPACRGNSPQARTAASSSRNAVIFSSACTTKRFPSVFSLTNVNRPPTNSADHVAIIDATTDEMVAFVPTPAGTHGVNWGAKRGGGYYAYVTNQQQTC